MLTLLLTLRDLFYLQLYFRFSAVLVCAGPQLNALLYRAGAKFSAVLFSAGTQHSAVIIAAHDTVTVLHYPGIARGPALVRVLSSGKAQH